jgi:tRNA wybutosine-synthesizing protein 2
MTASASQPCFILSEENLKRLYGFWAVFLCHSRIPVNHFTPLRVPTLVKGVRVPRARAEAVRLRLAADRAVDKSRAIIEEDDYVVIPLLEGTDVVSATGGGVELVDRDFPSRYSRNDPIVDIRDMAEIPEPLKERLPVKWEQFGDVLVLRLPHELDAHEAEVARAYASVLKVKSVLRDEGGITGELRTPVVRLLRGTDTVALHKENGVLFRFDVSKIMFSSGNTDERVRVAGIACDRETIVDMFAGIGYFSIPLAVHQRPKRIVACELNPASYSYLKENIELNHAKGVVEPMLGDNRTLEGESIADRVFMGYVKTTHEYLETAFRLVKSGGIVYYHETCPCELLPARPVERLRGANPGGSIDILGMREVKSYSPGVSHVVVETRVVKPA